MGRRRRLLRPRRNLILLRRTGRKATNLPRPGRLDLRQQSIRHLHRHAAEVRDEMSAVGVAREGAFGTLACGFAAEREEEAAVAAPIRCDVGERFETMRDPVVEHLVVVKVLCAKKHMNESAFRWRVASKCPLTVVSAFDLEIHFVTTFEKHFL